MPKLEALNGSKPRSTANWKRPLLYDRDIETLLKGLGLYAAQNVYNASDAYRLARALANPSRGRRERWVEPHYTLSQFLAEIERMIQMHRAESRKRCDLTSVKAKPRTEEQSPPMVR